MAISKISVIVPIYKVATYIERCVRSLFEQTLDAIEYIFIDDCTPDNSMEILERVISEYPCRSPFIRVVRMPRNTGVGGVRQKGVELSQGEYIIHCDGDDWVDPQLYETMYNEAVESDSDVVICPIQDEYSDSSSLRITKKLPDDCRIVLQNWYRDTIGLFVWNKLVKRNIIVDNDIRFFPGINMWEDNGFMSRVLYYSHTLSQIEGAAYHYNRYNSDAITYGYGRDAVDQMIKCASSLKDFFSKKPDYGNYYFTTLAFEYFARINLVTDSLSGLNEYKATFMESDAVIPYLDVNGFSKKGRIRFFFVRHHMGWLFVLLFKIYRKIKG